MIAITASDAPLPGAMSALDAAGQSSNVIAARFADGHLAAKNIDLNQTINSNPQLLISNLRLDHLHNPLLRFDPMSRHNHPQRALDTMAMPQSAAGGHP